MKRVIFILIFINQINASTIEYDYEFVDPYYVNINMFFPIINTKVEIINQNNEFLLYRDLLLDSFLPKFIYLEASINPMALAGLYWKYNYEEFVYDKEFDKYNIIDSMTAGIEEPHALSLFLGKVVKFGESKDELKTNRGFVGYLINYGNYHIKDLELIKDNWYEIEWKLKGTKIVAMQNLDWSFRIGTKQHSYQFISDSYYLGIRRSNVDILNTIPFISNSSVDYRVDISNFKIIRNYLTFDKKIKLFNTKNTISILLGFLHENQDKYTGPLERSQKESFKFIFRPNMTF